MNLFRPETLDTYATQIPNPYDALNGTPPPKKTSPRKRVQVDVAEPFTITQDNSALQSPTSQDEMYDRAYNCEYNVDLISIDRKNSTQRFRSLQAMYIGNVSPRNSEFTDRLSALLSNKHSHITVSQVKPTRARLADEVYRRFNYLKIGGPTPASTNYTIAKSTKVLNTSRYLLPIDELNFIEEEMDLFLTEQEKVLKREEQRIEDLGHEIRVSDRVKMRLWEAFFHDDNRVKLMKLQDVLNKQQLENMSSSQSQKTLYDDVSAMHNDPDWVPLSRKVTSFSSKLRKSFPLRLLAHNGSDTMTADQVKRHWVNAKGEYKRFLANWKRSGNGDGNYRSGTPSSSSTVTTTSEESGGGSFTTDDRQAFVNSIHMSYFWAVVEEIGLSDTICQSLSSIAFASTSSEFVSATTTIADRKKRNNKKGDSDESSSLVSIVKDLDKRLEKQNKRIVVLKLQSELREARVALADW
jgi:hypothetical protein